MNDRNDPSVIPGTLVIENEHGKVRNTYSVVLDPSNGAIHPSEAIPRDAYDWVSDSISFKMEGSHAVVPVDEGVLVDGLAHLDLDFGVAREDLAAVRAQWAQVRSRNMDKDLPDARPRQSGPFRM